MTAAESCAGKVRFETFSAAEATARKSRRSKNASRQTPYRCTICGGFHVGTHKLGRDVRRRPYQEFDADDL